jgi:hypothetical protein
VDAISRDTIDCEDVDLNGCDDACAAVDFDAFGNEIDPRRRGLRRPGPASGPGIEGMRVRDNKYSSIVSLAGFRVFVFVGARAVDH